MKWDLSKFNGKDIVFIGRAREGLSFEEFIRIYGTPRTFRFVDQLDGADYLDNLKTLDMNETVVVKTAGVPGRIVPVPYTTPTNVFFELVQATGATTVGVTGTKGKSTTSSLIHCILKEGGRKSILCGNIGRPMLDFLPQADASTTYIIELGAYQTADLTTSPHISLIINLFHEHLDYFGSVEAYYEAKHQLIAHMGSEDIFVYDPHYPELLDWAKNAKGKTVAIDYDGLKDIHMSKAKLMGEHNQKNILAAQTVARLLRVKDEVIMSAAYSFVPLKHRLQLIAHINDVMYYDDAISTTPQSAIAALQTIGNVGAMLLGGYDRDYDFSQLAALLAERKVPALVLFPPSGSRIKASLPEGYSPEIIETRDMEEAVRFAAAHAPKGSAVVLSTASPSYGLWKDFEEKGDMFQHAVKRLAR